MSPFRRINRQSENRKIVSKARGAPDFSFYANPSTGVEVYDSTPYEATTYDCLVVGGISIAPPALAVLPRPPRLN